MTRRRFVYTSGGLPLPEPYEVGADWTDAPDRTAPMTDLYMDGVRAPDGTDISSRTKRRAYMKANNLADSDDFKGTWAKAEKEREHVLRGGRDPRRREAVARAFHQRKR